MKRCIGNNLIQSMHVYLNIQVHKYTHLFGATFKHNILLTLVQPPLPHCPEVEDAVLSLEQLIQDI